MHPLPRPRLDAATVFGVCSNAAKLKKDKKALEGHSQTVVDAVAAYEAAAASRALHTLQHLVHEPGGAPDLTGMPPKPKTAAINVALINGYTNRMAKKGSAGHTFYLELQKSGPDGQCALCGCRYADTLDHQLPKTLYPLLAVAPSNLAPACSGCNKSKLDLNPVDASQQTLNPYFDHEADQHTWLTARITPLPQGNDTPFDITFHAEPPPDMPPVLAARAKFHIDQLHLAEVYASNAASRVRTESRLIRDLALVDPDDIREHLAYNAKNWTTEQRNGWEAALYTALANDDWYVNGGYLVVAG
ncbi:MULTISPECIES: HNH endonuclease [unclassified Kitasatospora]|uniref:HNH endonuclease n=1 Tax=unclassified Kitasatospora TaxID=2633591 RepID=UPI00070C0124|nr:MULTISPECIES: HNH endonuclease [unclassified Kitasatospora]KQV20903.1 hypothetical protein ASC99_20580 [Kitasatospora sp. Root107]KRB60444.1 hypothetical protein ASE03_12605 [Kitasatospora sp. Root187]